MNEHLDSYSIAALCEALQVSRSGFYAWRARAAKGRTLDQAVAAAYERHQTRAGAPCLASELRATGYAVSNRTVSRSMQRQRLAVRYKKKFRHTTDSNHRLAVAPNRLERQFTVAAPNTVWVGDITYLRTNEGWLYLAVMIDLHSRQVVGWQMSRKIDQQLVNDALKAALINRGQPQGVMIHTDRGSQYCADSFVDLIERYKLVQSMSRKANCWDNAVAESFFASLKKQAIYGHALTDREQMRQVVFEYIEIYYNRVRRHSANGWVTPVEYDRLYNQRLEDSTV
jgi:putative transposase